MHAWLVRHQQQTLIHAVMSTAVTTSDAQGLAFSPNQKATPMNDAPSIHTTGTVPWWRMMSCFNSYAQGLLDLLSPETTEALLKSGKRVSLGDGQLFQSRGSDQIGMVVVLQGNVRLMTLGKDGTALLTAIFGPGQQFNEVTLFANVHLTHDVVSIGHAELLVLTSDQLDKLAQQHPEIMKALLVSNTQRLHQLVEILNDFRALPKRLVVARLLFKNARHQGAIGLNKSVELKITQEDIAMFVGVTRAYLNKVLADLSALGLIEVSYRKIKILDLSQFEAWIDDNLSYVAVENFQAPQPV